MPTNFDHFYHDSGHYFDYIDDFHEHYDDHHEADQHLFCHTASGVESAEWGDMRRSSQRCRGNAVDEHPVQ